MRPNEQSSLEASERTNKISLIWNKVFFAPLPVTTGNEPVYGFVVFPNILQLNFHMNFDLVKECNIKSIFRPSLWHYYTNIEDEVLETVLTNSEGYGFIVTNRINEKKQLELRKSLIVNLTQMLKYHYKVGMLPGYNNKKFNDVIMNVIQHPEL